MYDDAEMADFPVTYSKVIQGTYPLFDFISAIIFTIFFQYFFSSLLSSAASGDEKAQLYNKHLRKNYIWVIDQV